MELTAAENNHNSFFYFLQETIKSFYHLLILKYKREISKAKMRKSLRDSMDYKAYNVQYNSIASIISVEKKKSNNIFMRYALSKHGLDKVDISRMEIEDLEHIFKAHLSQKEEYEIIPNATCFLCRSTNHGDTQFKRFERVRTSECNMINSGETHCDCDRIFPICQNCFKDIVAVSFNLFISRVLVPSRFYLENEPVAIGDTCSDISELRRTMGTDIYDKLFLITENYCMIQCDECARKLCIFSLKECRSDCQDFGKNGENDIAIIGSDSNYDKIAIPMFGDEKKEDGSNFSEFTKAICKACESIEKTQTSSRKDIFDIVQSSAKQISTLTDMSQHFMLALSQLQRTNEEQSRVNKKLAEFIISNNLSKRKRESEYIQEEDDDVDSIEEDNNSSPVREDDIKSNSKIKKRSRTKRIRKVDDAKQRPCTFCSFSGHYTKNCNDRNILMREYGIDKMKAEQYKYPESAGNMFMRLIGMPPNKCLYFIEDQNRYVEITYELNAQYMRDFKTKYNMLKQLNPDLDLRGNTLAGCYFKENGVKDISSKVPNKEKDYEKIKAWADEMVKAFENTMKKGSESDSCNDSKRSDENEEDSEEDEDDEDECNKEEEYQNNYSQYSDTHENILDDDLIKKTLEGMSNIDHSILDNAINLQNCQETEFMNLFLGG